MVLCAASTGSNTCCPLAAMVSVFEGGSVVMVGERMRITAQREATGRELYCAHALAVWCRPADRKCGRQRCGA